MDTIWGLGIEIIQEGWFGEETLLIRSIEQGRGFEDGLELRSGLNNPAFG